MNIFIQAFYYVAWRVIVNGPLKVLKEEKNRMQMTRRVINQMQRPCTLSFVLQVKRCSIEFPHVEVQMKYEIKCGKFFKPIKKRMWLKSLVKFNVLTSD